MFVFASLGRRRRRTAAWRLCVTALRYRAYKKDLMPLLGSLPTICRSQLGPCGPGYMPPPLQGLIEFDVFVYC